ncbi:hypothetical protein CEXT_580211 [Caerostris extrusa]|uniref:Uncharacterized protein n=1 Tax=Caerostris extrusa TaxID=172846 RepID=A0AAV4SMR3_CAEEX|nr:hypothetical protein CEXT_580211 [Caerostris extrusa]
MNTCPDGRMAGARETQLQAAKFKDGAIFGLIKEYKQRIYIHNYNFGVKSAVKLHKGYCSCYDPSKLDHFLFSRWLKSSYHHSPVMIHQS